MNEHDVNRLSRWGIPGWIAILSFFAFILVDVIFSRGNLKLYNDLSTFLTSFNQVSSVYIALVIAAAGVPFGFAIYQAYFFIRWNSPFSRDGLAPPFIVGRMEDLARTLRDIQPDELIGSEQWRKNWVEHPLFQRDHGWKWRYIELFMTEISQKIDATSKGPSVFQRYRYLVDLMHTLGASLFGIYFGFLFYVIFKLYKEDLFFISYLAAVIFPLGLLIFFLDREDRAKKDLEKENRYSTAREQMQSLNEKSDGDHPITTWDFSVPFISKARFQIVHPGSLLLAFFAFTHIISNPNLFFSSSQELNCSAQLVMSLSIILVWGWSKKKWVGIVVTETFILGLSLISAFTLNKWIEMQKWEFDWPFLICSYVFLIANMIMLKNRQNTRDDVIAIQYYTLRRYLTEQAASTPKEEERYQPNENILTRLLHCFSKNQPLS